MASVIVKIGDSVQLNDGTGVGTIVNVTNGKYEVDIDGQTIMVTSSEFKKFNQKPKPEKKRSEIKRIAPCKKVSENKNVLNKIYAKVREKYMKEHTKCEAHLEGCTKVATEVHHMNGRMGIWLVISEYFLPVCRNCHMQITENSAMAIENGLSISKSVTVDKILTDYEKELLKTNLSKFV